MDARRLCSIAVIGMLCTLPIVTQAQPVANLEPARLESCLVEAGKCENADAIVFVHGIYGGDTTFVNTSTGYKWPQEFPPRIQGRDIDTYLLEYRTALLAWAKDKNPEFESVANAVYRAMKPLRKERYRSIGFITHSLGGNIVSTYLHMVKTRLGHPQRSQHAYVVTLATPVLGSQIADIWSLLKESLGMSDPLLESLMADNLYLKMLQNFRSRTRTKAAIYACRPVHLHAAFEEKHLGPIKVVSESSAAGAVKNMVASPIMGFQLDHSEIAKPSGPSHPVFRWVWARLSDEFDRLDEWEDNAFSRPWAFRLCQDIPFKYER